MMVPRILSILTRSHYHLIIASLPTQIAIVRRIIFLEIFKIEGQILSRFDVFFPHRKSRKLHTKFDISLAVRAPPYVKAALEFGSDVDSG
jgi:hypothetical protein